MDSGEKYSRALRALVGQQPIVLFDDANAGFDMQNDNALMQFLETYKGKRTMVLVSHRPSMLRMPPERLSLIEPPIRVSSP